MLNIPQRIKDFFLELRIALARWDILLSADAEETRRHYLRMARLIRRRSPAQIARMAKKRGTYE